MPIAISASFYLNIKILVFVYNHLCLVLTLAWRWFFLTRLIEVCPLEHSGTVDMVSVVHIKREVDAAAYP